MAHSSREPAQRGCSIPQYRSSSPTRTHDDTDEGGGHFFHVEGPRVAEITGWPQLIVQDDAEHCLPFSLEECNAGHEPPIE